MAGHPAPSSPLASVRDPRVPSTSYRSETGAPSGPPPLRGAPPRLPGLAWMLERVREWGTAWGVPTLASRTRIAYSRRMRIHLGRTDVLSGRIHLNRRLLESHPSELLPTLCHEAAHFAATLLHGPGIKPHGPEWRHLMEMAGFPPIRACSLGGDGAGGVTALRRYLHACPRCGYRALPTRSRRVDARCPCCSARGLAVWLHLETVLELPA